MDAGEVEAAHTGLVQEAAWLREYGPAETVAGAVQSIEDVERRIAGQQYDVRARKLSRYRSASYRKMSSAEMWCASEAAPDFKKPQSSARDQQEPDKPFEGSP